MRSYLCNYPHGDEICKYVVAVLFHLREASDIKKKFPENGWKSYYKE
jgi:hypothetical protein